MRVNTSCRNRCWRIDRLLVGLAFRNFAKSPWWQHHVFFWMILVAEAQQADDPLVHRL